MTTSTRSSLHFNVRSSNVSALLVAALCAFIVSAFVIDVQRGASRPDAPVAEQRS